MDVLCDKQMEFFMHIFPTRVRVDGGGRDYCSKWTRQKAFSPQPPSLLLVFPIHVQTCHKKGQLTHSFVHIGGCIQLSFSKDSWSNQMEKKSKGEKPF